MSQLPVCDFSSTTTEEVGGRISVSEILSGSSSGSSAANIYQNKLLLK
jgi:hypothetical protein